MGVIVEVGAVLSRIYTPATMMQFLLRLSCMSDVSPFSDQSSRSSAVSTALAVLQAAHPDDA
jgi:hypothetical protein